MKKLFTIGLLSLVFSLFAPKASAESVVYIIMGADMPTVSNIPLSINGKQACSMDLKFKEKQFKVNIYRRAIKKIILNSEDKFILSYDIPWVDGIRHDEITIDAVDGETYYIQLISKWNLNFKRLKEKDGIKKLKKTDDYDFLPDYVHPAE